MSLEPSEMFKALAVESRVKIIDLLKKEKNYILITLMKYYLVEVKIVFFMIKDQKKENRKEKEKKIK